MVADLDTPWSLAFLPDGGKLITERDGSLQYISPDWTRAEITGLPEVYDSGQGGLFDVVVARDYPETGEIFLTYAEPRSGGAGTVLATARLSIADQRLDDLRILFGMKTDSDGGRHFGGRLVEAADGTLFLTLGERGDRPEAQATDVHNGKIVRLNRDGTIPADNPFVNGPHLPEVWTIGHRNPQGLAFAEDGTLWTNSHGARGGDEVNLIAPGLNYGWPEISYGKHYSGGQIGSGTHKEGMEQPKWVWDPSIAPSGLMIYSGRIWPEWEGDLFIGSLKHDLIARLDRDGDKVQGEEHLFKDAFTRIRDIREGPDGAIWFLAEGDDALYRITPAR
ncbi:PQQ-dependent sugar dehydrogenase [Rhodobacteraceae bacterium NNCM2]|nr:PQQ-dependent sugar dehydrogenase [Coraliihabitans acroporae]